MAESSDFIIVTGMSGAGKSQTLNCLEDFGYFCVDNLPLAILPKFIELTRKIEDKFKKAALGVDIREIGFIRDFQTALDELKNAGIRYTVIFLDADDQVLVRRFSETRRRHPLGRNIVDGIKEERKKIAGIKASADKIIDTSALTLGELKEITRSLLEHPKKPSIQFNLVSFGYKYGIPMDSDMVFDVRFLPNPNYEKNLKNKTGRDSLVGRFIKNEKECGLFLGKIEDLFNFLIPLFIKEGKSYLTLAVGCTGGRHRSVFIAEQFSKIIKKLGYSAKLSHRDINKAVV